MDNIYDDEDFFTAYAGMERSGRGSVGGRSASAPAHDAAGAGGEGAAQPLFSARV